MRCLDRFIRWALLLAVTTTTATVRAAVPLCIEVQGEDAEGVRKLVLAEVGHHPSHAVATEACTSTLRVELFKAAGQLQLTARIDQEIPVRYPIEDPRDLPRRLSQGLALVLGNDPAYLSADIAHMSAAERLRHSLLVTGENTYRVELFQTISRAPNAVFAPGAAFAFTRGSGHWQVLARAYLGGWPGAVSGSERVLRVLAGVDAGLTYEVSARANTSFYVSSGVAFQFMQFEGLLRPADKGSGDTMNALLFGVQARIGVRFLRFADFDCDLFVAGHLPFYAAHSEDSPLFGEKGVYTPSLQLGFGVGF